MKNLLLAISSGVLLSIAWPDIGDFTFLVFFSLIPILYLENQTKEQKFRLFAYAYITFFVWNLLTTWWVYFASPIGVIIAVVLNSLFTTIVFFLFHLTKKRLGSKNGYVAFICYWLLWEYLHQDWDLSWPWLTIGNVFANNITWIQWYEYTGVFGGGLWVLIVNVLVFKTIMKINHITPIKLGLMAGIITLIIVIPIIWSKVKYSHVENNGKTQEVLVIQPNIDPYNEKFDGLSPEAQLEKILALAEKKITTKTRYVVAPETAISRAIWMNEMEKSPSYKKLKKFIAKHPQINIVIGLTAGKFYHTKETSSARAIPSDNLWYDYFNSAMQLDNGNNVQLYHKSKLVPGVEKMPFAKLLKPLSDLAFDLGGTSGSLGTQENRTPFFTSNKETSIAPVICYESIYGEYVGEYIKNGAQAIFIITNDGWWNDTPGYKQHLAYARLRAIETRKSIARSANTGISCFINQRGDIKQATKWWKEDVISQLLHFNNKQTFYTKYGDYIARIAGFIAAILLLWTFVKLVGKDKMMF